MDKFQNLVTAINAVHFLLSSGVVDPKADAHGHLKDLAASLVDHLNDLLYNIHA